MTVVVDSERPIFSHALTIWFGGTETIITDDAEARTVMGPQLRHATSSVRSAIFETAQHGDPQVYVGGLQLALEPAHRFLGFQGIGPVAIETLERLPSLAIGRQR